jgi:hypothetical protein
LERLVKINDNPIQWKTNEVYRYILFNKYAVSTDVIAGDLVNESIVAYAEGYNKIFIPVIINFYGFDIFQKANEEIPGVIIKEGQYHKEWVYDNNY